MSLADNTIPHLEPLLNTYRPATEQDYTGVLSTREILTLIYDSTLNDGLDGPALELELTKQDFKKIANGSGEFWLVKEWA